MTWQPSTRGLGGSKALCSYRDCQDIADITDYYTRDSLAARFFCTHHWKSMKYYFNLVAACPYCIRSHKADYYREARTIDTVKISGKWWEVCATHKSVYDDSVDLTVDSWFDED